MQYNASKLKSIKVFLSAGWKTFQLKFFTGRINMQNISSIRWIKLNTKSRRKDLVFLVCTFSLKCCHAVCMLEQSAHLRNGYYRI